jgi:post-segregation antitoxin (ccd killing protein)
LAQKPWHVLSRSEQLLASAGAASVNISAAAQESLAPQSKNLRNFASQSDPSER